MLETDLSNQPSMIEAQKLLFAAKNTLRSSPDARIAALESLVRVGAPLFVKVNPFSAQRSVVTAEDLGDAAIDSLLTGSSPDTRLQFRRGNYEIAAQFPSSDALCMQYREWKTDDLASGSLVAPAWSTLHARIGNGQVAVSYIDELGERLEGCPAIPRGQELVTKVQSVAGKLDLTS